MQYQPVMNAVRWIWRLSGAKTVWTAHRFGKLQREWLRVAGRCRPLSSRLTRMRVVLIPCDPLLLTASRGDEAMLTTLIAACRDMFIDPEFVIVTAGAGADALARRLGAQPCRALEQGLSLDHALKRILALKITHCITLGADVIDGSYDPVFSARLLALTDLLARSGVQSLVNGFSWSQHPSALLAAMFPKMSPKLTFNSRDPISQNRFIDFTGVPAELTADIAFLLKPESLLHEKVRPLATWIAAQRKHRHQVIGFNIHPMLVDLEQRQARLPALIAEFSAAVQEIIESEGVSVVLLEHDFRGVSADFNCLDRIEAHLRARGCGAYVHRASEPMNAAELKAVAGCLDGVATGRMHLAIAALGMGVPVLLFGYKGKMEGLLKHFSLDDRLLLTGADLLDRGRLIAQMRLFIGEVGGIERQIERRLPVITELARKNLSSFEYQREVPKATRSHLASVPSPSPGLRRLVPGRSSLDLS